jgi:Ca2+/Na+ antiporter
MKTVLNMKMKSKNWTINKSTAAIVIIAFGVSGILIVNPIKTTSVKISILFFLALIFLSPFVFFRKNLKTMISIAVIYLLALIYIFLPARPYDKESIRQRYVLNLAATKGLSFIWGGESHFGADCSGLVRKEFENALIEEGLMTFNPSLIRKALYIWWYDCDAKSLKNGYKDFTFPIFSGKNVNSIDSKNLMPGDLAVIDDGSHVMAYIGNNKWIEADPEELNVLCIDTPSNNPWFSMPTTIVRWKILQ